MILPALPFLLGTTPVAFDPIFVDEGARAEEVSSC